MAQFHNHRIMKAITYSDGNLVKLGDLVVVKSAFGRERTGKVIYVYDPHHLSGPNGKNDYGISIRFENGNEIWGVPDKNTTLLSRS